MIKRPCFVTLNGIENGITSNDIEDGDESFISASLWGFRRGFITYRVNRKCVILMLLLVCGDIESCPGPSIFGQKGLKIVHQNVRGLLTNFHMVENFTDTHKIDILTLSETHITETQDSSMFAIDGFTFLHKNRLSGSGGGVAVYIRDGINFNRRFDLEDENIENITIEVFVNKSKSFLISTFYRPPNSSKYLHKNFNKLFNDILSLLMELKKEIIIMGDMNTDYLKTNDNKEIKDIIKLYGLTQLVKKPTRITQETSSLIDIIATNEPSNISFNDVIPTSISDHDMVCCVRKLNSFYFSPKTIHCRNYRKYNKELMINEINETDWEQLYACDDVNIALTWFTKTVSYIFNKHAPSMTKKIRGKKCEWMNNEIKDLMLKRNSQHKKARKTKRENDWSTYKSLRNRCNNMIKHAKSVYHKNKIRENASKPEKFWSCIKEIYPTKSKVCMSPLPEKLKSFKSYFSTIVGKLKKIAFPLADFTWKKPVKVFPRTYNTFRFSYVSHVFVAQQLRLLKKNKSTGCDNLPARMLKDSSTVLSKQVAFIINLSLKTSNVPTMWKCSKIVPVYKSGSSDNVENYRPISILPVLSKIMEKAVQQQLLHYLETNKLLSKYQFGYRNGKSTQSAMVLLSDNIRRSIDKGELVGSVFLDLTKAFDTISHDLLLQKISSYGVREKEFDWFVDYLFRRGQKVIQGDATSTEFFLTSGVPQGSILGPLMFILFINDMPECLKSANMILYADDAVIFFNHKNVDIIQKTLNGELNNIKDFFMKNELIINLKKGKTESMLFGTARKCNSIDLNVTFDDEPVNKVETYKYLGCWFDSSLSLNQHFDSCYKKTCGRVKLLSKIRTFLTTDATIKVCQAMIIPLMTYSCIINMNLTVTQKRRLLSIDRRIQQIVGEANNLPSIETIMKRDTCLFVKKCLNNELCSNFENYFDVIGHNKNTRQGLYLRLPAIRLESTKNSFFFAGAKLFNNLPNDIRNTRETSTFKGNLKEL